MSFYYPQAVLTLNVRWENFGFESSPALNKTHEMFVFAKRLNVNINDYTQADSFTCELEYNNFPFDPRCIRALGVTVHLEDMRSLYNTDGSLNTITPKKENIVFVGFADEETIKLDDSSRTISFEGRDYTALLIDSPYDGRTIDLGTKLDDIVAELLGRLDATKQIKVINRTGEELPIIAKFSPGYDVLGKDRSAKRNETFWDVIQDLVARAGLIAYIELDSLIISKPRVLYQDSRDTEFIYGRNLKSLSFKRKLGRRKGINVAVRALNLESKELLEARIPEEASEAWSIETKISRTVQTVDKIKPDGTVDKVPAPYLAFRVADVADKAQLIKIGEGIFEEVGRQQIEGSIETLEMCVKTDGIEYDLLKLRNGAPVRIEIDAQDIEGITRLNTFGARLRFLKARCYPDEVANALAESLGLLDTRFYTKGLSFSMDGESGFKMQLDFLNFIEVTNKGIF